MDRNLQTLGIAKKAGLIVIGSEDVGVATRLHKARLVLTAGDASASAIRRARANAEAGGAAYISVPYTMSELGGVTGRGSPGTLAITDAGLAASFVKGLAGAEPDRYSEVAGQLTERSQKRRRSKDTPSANGPPQRALNTKAPPRAQDSKGPRIEGRHSRPGRRTAI